jgi:hypothetical protein
LGSVSCPNKTMLQWEYTTGPVRGTVGSVVNAERERWATDKPDTAKGRREKRDIAPGKARQGWTTSSLGKI